jgi:hypothetical protein
MLLLWCGVRAVSSIQFDQQCEGYLKRAADANNIELAREELGKALQYTEAHGLTEGYTSVLYRTPDEDLGFWYTNLKAAHSQLGKINQDSISDLEESNVLMKLRETLCDSGKSGSSITVPSGISVFPNNTLWFIIGWGGLLFLLIGIPYEVFVD